MPLTPLEIYHRAVLGILRDIGWVANGRQLGAIFPDTQKDAFNGYGGDQLAQNASSALAWLQLARMESLTDLNGTWTTLIGGAAAISTDQVREGTYSVKVTHSGGNIVVDYFAAFDATADGRFTADDYVVFEVYLDAVPSTLLRISFNSTGGGADYDFTLGSLSTGWNYLYAKRSDFFESSHDWSDIQRVTFTAQGSATTIYLDNLQLVKASQADPDYPNPTGPLHGSTTRDNWYFRDEDDANANARAAILTDMPGFAYALGLLDSSKDITAVKDGDYMVREHYSGAVLAREDGELGLLFCAKDYLNGYVLALDTSGDTLTLYSRSAGVDSQLAQVSYTAAIDTVYYLGVKRVDDGSGNATIEAYISTLPGDIFTGNNLQISYDDSGGANYGAGHIGVVAYSINARFSELLAGSPEHALTADLARAAKSVLSPGESQGAALLADGNGGSAFGQGVDTDDSPTFADLTVDSLTLNDLTASQLVQTDGSKVLASVATIQAYQPDFAWGRLVANRLALPGLRGLWNMHAGYRGTGTTQIVIDLSNQEHDLTINGNPTFSVQQETGLPEVPYIDLDGTGDYLAGARVAGGWNAITGAVTLMGWYAADDATPSSVQIIAGHYLTTGNQRSFALLNQVGGNLTAIISADGSATFTADTTPTVISDGVWNHIVLRYIPSAELSIFLNGVETLNTTSIPAALHDSTGDFNLGSGSGGQLNIAGLMALWSLHAAALTDEAIAADFAQSRGLFGV